MTFSTGGEGSIPSNLCNCRNTPPTAQKYHDPECPAATDYDRWGWARETLADPRATAVAASGMSREDLDAMRDAFE